MKPAYVLPNGKKLGAGDFCRYFEKKVLYSVRKFGMPREVRVKKDGLNSKVLFCLFERFGFLKRGAKAIALDDSTDDFAAKIMESWFGNRSPGLPPSSKKEIRPLFLMTEQEIGIYASLKRISGKSKKKSPARLMLDDMEKRHPEIKRAIVQSWLQMLEIRGK